MPELVINHRFPLRIFLVYYSVICENFSPILFGSIIRILPIHFECSPQRKNRSTLIFVSERNMLSILPHNPPHRQFRLPIIQIPIAIKSDGRFIHIANS